MPFVGVFRSFVSELGVKVMFVFGGFALMLPAMFCRIAVAKLHHESSCRHSTRTSPTGFTVNSVSRHHLYPERRSLSHLIPSDPSKGLVSLYRTAVRGWKVPRLLLPWSGCRPERKSI